MKQWISACLSLLTLLSLTACGSPEDDPKNLISQSTEEKQIVSLFSPMEKSNPNAENVARTAADLTVAMAEAQLGIRVDYWTYTAEDYQDKTYDEVSLERVRSNMDDLYLLNPNVILTLGAEDRLMDLSELDSAKNLREIVYTANTVDGKLVAIPGSSGLRSVRQCGSVQTV